MDLSEYLESWKTLKDNPSLDNNLSDIQYAYIL